MPGPLPPIGGQKIRTKYVDKKDTRRNKRGKKEKTKCNDGHGPGGEVGGWGQQASRRVCQPPPGFDGSRPPLRGTPASRRAMPTGPSIWGTKENGAGGRGGGGVLLRGSPHGGGGLAHPPPRAPPLRPPLHGLLPQRASRPDWQAHCRGCKRTSLCAQRGEGGWGE